LETLIFMKGEPLMKQGYQRTREKSKPKFEVVGSREVVVRLPLPLVEVWEELQADVERLAGEAGLKILHGILEEEVTQRVGPPHRPDPASGARRWGRQPGYVIFGGQKIPLERPRVRTRTGEEVELENYGRLQQDGRMQRAVAERVVCGLSTRKYRRAVQSVLDGYGIRKSSVSRHFVRATAERLRELGERRLEELNLVALLIDGIEFAGQTLIVALGVEENGSKHVLGLWQGATENTTVCKALLEDLVARGLDPSGAICSCSTARRPCARRWTRCSARGRKCSAARSTSDAMSKITCPKAAAPTTTASCATPTR
jgi:hypothetical protein